MILYLHILEFSMKYMISTIFGKCQIALEVTGGQSVNLVNYISQGKKICMKVILQDVGVT